MNNRKYLQLYDYAYQALCRWEIRDGVNDNPAAALVLLAFLKYVSDNEKGLEMEGIWRCEGLAAQLAGYAARIEYRLGFEKKILSSFVQDFALENLEKDILELLLAFEAYDFSVEGAGYAPYDALVSYLSALVRKDLRFSQEGFTDVNLSKLMAEVAGVQPGSRFLDFASGFGISAAECLRGKEHVWASLQDIKKANCAVSLMLMTLGGMKGMGISCGDSFQEKELWEKSYDVIVCDPPLMYKKSRESNPLWLTAGALAPGGTGILIVPLGMLTRMGQDREVRSELLRKHFVKAVAELPAGIIPGTTARSALIVLQNYERESSVYFLNLGSAGARKYLKKLPRSGYTIQDDKIKEVAELIRQKAKIPGVARAAGFEDIKAEGYNLSPGTYIETMLESLAEIENIEELQEQNDRLLSGYQNAEARFRRYYDYYMELKKLYEEKKE